MGVKGEGGYCAFTKAVEHLGDRWSLVILRELTIHGTRGFNALADGVPGISRSVLAARLRKLEDLELVTRDRSSRQGVPGYQLTHAGRELQPILRGLWQWSLRFVPEDPAMAERDPDIVIRWLAERVDVSNVPDRPVVLDLDVRGTGSRRFWLVLERGTRPSICIEDPILAGDRYLFVEADVRALYPIARRTRGWAAAIEDGSVQVFGAPELVEALPSWFVSSNGSESDTTRVRHLAARRHLSIEDEPNRHVPTVGAPAPHLAAAPQARGAAPSSMRSPAAVASDS